MTTNPQADALREIVRILGNEFIDQFNDFGDVGKAMERCYQVAQRALGEDPRLPDEPLGVVVGSD